MKKTSFVVAGILVAVLVLSGCSTAQPGAASPTSSTVDQISAQVGQDLNNIQATLQSSNTGPSGLDTTALDQSLNDLTSSLQQVTPVAASGVDTSDVDQSLTALTSSLQQVTPVVSSSVDTSSVDQSLNDLTQSLNTEATP
jgi:outer membrane murein-binding lipoprotein Lpp